MTRHLYRRAAIGLLSVLALLSVAASVSAQPVATLRVVRRAPIVETPRVDGFILGTVEPGTQLEVIAQQGGWLQVLTPAGFNRPRGWIQTSAVEMLTPMPGRPAPPKGERLVRAFGTVAPTFFTADDSMELVLGSATGLFFGGGAQYVWSNGAFVLGTYERMQDTGTRVLVSGSQVFQVGVADTVTVTPVTFTVGYRDYKTRAVAPYGGFGAGWHRLRETSDDGTAAISKSHVSGHILGGVERRVAPWLSVAGEAQWTWAQKIIGETGLSAAAGEDDLGGVSLRVKVIVGR
jgi:hypothetical protein